MRSTKVFHKNYHHLRSLLHLDTSCRLISVRMFVCVCCVCVCAIVGEFFRVEAVFFCGVCMCDFSVYCAFVATRTTPTTHTHTHARTHIHAYVDGVTMVVYVFVSVLLTTVRIVSDGATQQRKLRQQQLLRKVDQQTLVCVCVCMCACAVVLTDVLGCTVC